MSNPYHVVLNRQSSGERGAVGTNDTESHGDGDEDRVGDNSNNGVNSTDRCDRSR